jgi:hypothetical protein
VCYSFSLYSCDSLLIILTMLLVLCTLTLIRKFHFKLYLLCCTTTNLVYKLRVHTKDGSDALNELVNINEDITTGKIEKQTMEMCAPLHGRHATVTMDNYFMTTNLATKLLQQKVYCRGAI